MIFYFIIKLIIIQHLLIYLSTFNDYIPTYLLNTKKKKY